MLRPSLMSLLAGMAALAAVANGVAVSAGPPAQPDTRLGVSIKQSLGERDRAAVKRQRALDMREQGTLATERRLKTQLAERAPGADPEGAVADGSAPEADQYESLARIYQAMKPAKAAKVFEQLDINVQMRVAQKMRDRATGAILAAMHPKAAAALSMALARQHVITAPQRAKPARS